MPRICCISDTHSQNLTTKWEWPQADILVHAGDMSAKGSPDSLKQVARQIHQLPYRYKVVVGGNHDRAFWEKGKYNLEVWKYFPGIIVLEDECVKLLGLKIYGSSWIKFKEGKYPFEIENLKEKWDKIPDHTDILITHMPPHGMLDINGNGESMGSKSLANVVRERVKPRLHVYGHIHSGYGQH